MFAQRDKKMQYQAQACNNQPKLAPRTRTYLAIARLALQKCFCPIILTISSGDMSTLDTHSTIEVSDKSSLRSVSPVCDDLHVFCSWNSVSLIRLLGFIRFSYANSFK